MADRAVGLIIDRAVQRVRDNGDYSPAEPLSAYRKRPAYVLVGDPGAGKTAAFRKEELDSAGSALFVSARDFTTLDPAHHPDWHTKTLLLDGLDEIRTGRADVQAPFDKIRTRLDQLGKPRFRISCREADWLGASDRQHLKAVSPAGDLVVLRLTPLGGAEIRALVAALLPGGDPDMFLREAGDRGLEGLLSNPQTLVLLLKAFGATRQWPADRRETFEKGIERLAQEPNEEHRIGSPEVPLGDILNAAEWISAVHLLSGTARHCLSEHDAGPGDVALTTYREDLRGTAGAALRTRLFTALGKRRLEPTHTNIAAFLAARMLADVVRGGLPGGRALALLAGEDGAPPTALRGLAAWLAVFSSELRKTLIERDPVAVLMYGDVRDFSPDEKTLVLDEISRDPSRLYDGLWPASAVGALVTADMVPTLRNVLGDPDRSDAKQQVAEVVTRALFFATASPTLSAELPALVRDETRWPAVRRRALDAWIHTLQNTPNSVYGRRELLIQIYNAPNGDSHGELLATLLRNLYPYELSPEEVWDYFPSHMGSPQGLACEFWQQLARKCPGDHLIRHMERLADLIGNLRAALSEKLLDDVPLWLLARALERSGNQITGPQLFRWLSVGLDDAGHLCDRGSDPKDLIARVAAWLEAHPDLQKRVVEIALGDHGFRPRGTVGSALRELLYRSELPDDWHWHLDQAVHWATADLDNARFHLTEFRNALASNPAGVDGVLDGARARLRNHPEALEVLRNTLKTDLEDDYLTDRIQREHLHSVAGRTDPHMLEAVRSHHDELRENRAPAGLLHGIAHNYCGGSFNSWTQGDPDRVVDALGGDERLADAALTGIRRSADRNDLPEVRDILKLRMDDQISLFTLPVLAGLAERNVEDIRRLSDAQLRTALAFRLVAPTFASEAEWYAVCLRERSSLVADVLIPFGRGLLQAGERYLPDVYRLAREPTYAQLARKVTMPLLRAFPARAGADQHELLEGLLQSALVHCEQGALQEVIERKARLGSLTKTQRLYWLSAGLAIDPRHFGPLLSETADTDSTSRVLEQMFPSETSVHHVPELIERLDPGAAEFLIREIGGNNAPPSFEAPISVGWGRDTAIGVENLITGLGRNPAPEATSALEQLAADRRLAPWRRHLEHARETQQVTRRDANYAPPTPAAVIAALRNGPPATSAELSALAIDRLNQLGREINATGTDLWQFFWNQDSHGRPTEPKPENPCRDAVLALLRPKLPEGCTAELETMHAGKRRADIGISYGKLKVPVEIKKNAHSDIWRTVRNQLLPRYTNDPATEGLGIYLVLWFGPQQTAPVPAGPRPQTPDELQDGLLAELTPEERRRAAVLVMDVTRPPPTHR